MVEKFDYDESQLDANELIEEFGATVTLRHFTSSGPNYSPVRTPTDLSAIAAIVEYRHDEIDGSRILRTDRRALIAVGNLSAAPEPGWQLLIGGDVYSVVSVETLSPAGTPVYFDAQVRK